MGWCSGREQRKSSPLAHGWFQREIAALSVLRASPCRLPIKWPVPAALDGQAALTSRRS